MTTRPVCPFAVGDLVRPTGAWTPHDLPSGKVASIDPWGGTFVVRVEGVRGAWRIDCLERAET